MSFTHYRLLMWKNYRLKLYHYFATLAELLGPIIITLYFVLTTPHDRNKSNFKIENFPPYPVSALTIQNLELCYFPDNDITSDFMRKLRERNPINLTTTPLLNEIDIKRYVLNYTEKPVVGVHLQNLKSDKSTPYTFSYTIMHLISNDESYSDSFHKTHLILNENFIEYVAPASTNSKKMTDELHIQNFPIINVIPRLELQQLLSCSYIPALVGVVLLADIMEEKNNGLKEMMKISGVKEFTIWLNWFVYAVSVILLSFTVSCALLTMFPMKDGTPAYNCVPFLVIWLLLFLWLIANITLCFFLSSVFQSLPNANLAYTMYLLIIIFIIQNGFGIVKTYVPLYVLCFIPYFAFQVGILETQFIEIKDNVFTWSTLIKSQNGDVQVPFGLLYVYFTLIFDSLLFLFLAYYITLFMPGQFGSSKSPFSFLKKLFWKKVDGENPKISNSPTQLDPMYFEPPPPNMNPSIQIIDLHKRFKSVHAVRGVNLVTYENEITVLLGHNGAGKTTTISVLTGLTAPSSGQAFYKDINVFENMEKFRSRLGWCPQENRFFIYLSVMDHLLFFAQLKGVSKEDAIEEAKEYLDNVGMISKMNSNVAELSGGMKRKLSLCIAMMGKAEVLILDEPSSGMDAESRRSLRDLLWKIRKGRSLILTTHYMEEADMVGDRVAIMNHGVIVCHGTPMFLKKAYDTGYELTLTKTSDNSAAITNLIQSALPTTSVLSDTKQEIVYKLPLTETHQFPALFKSLESAKTGLGIKTIEVTATTMEQVFLKSGDSTSAFRRKSSRNIKQAAKFDKVTGFWLFLQQLQALIQKKFLFTKRDRRHITQHFLVNTILCCVVLILKDKFISNLSGFQPSSKVSLSTSPAKMVMYDEKNPSPFGLGEQVEKYVTENYGIFMRGNGSGIYQMIDSLVNDNLYKYTENVASGIELNGSRTKLMHKSSSLVSLFSFRSSANSLPITIDLYSNALLRKKTNNDQYSIETTSYAMDNDSESRTSSGNSIGPANESTFVLNTKFYTNLIVWFIVLGFFVSNSLLYFWNFVNVERLDGFYHIQMMSQLHPFVYWLGTLIFDFTLFFIIMIVQMALYKTITHIQIIGFHEFFYVYVLMIFLHTISGLIMLYMLTYMFSFGEMSSEAGIIDMLYKTLPPALAVGHLILKMLFDQPAENLLLFLLFNAIAILVYSLPPSTFLEMFINLIFIFSNNEKCSSRPESERTECEAALVKYKFWEFASENNPHGLLSFLLAFCGQIAVYSLLIWVSYSGYPRNFFNMIKGTIFGIDSMLKDTGDDDVQKERDKAQRLFSEAKNTKEISLLVDRLRKNYIPRFTKFTAVSDVSFAVERGTCFGLLGVNGAGKTTTFKMLTAEILPTSGDAMIDEYKLSENKSQYIRMAGYCSQINCFIEQLTGFELLMIIAAFRGVSRRDRRKLVDKWISIIGLDEYKNRQCGTYSGGNKRKLCAAMSLIGDPLVAFLDEPTTGVDPMSRRNLYDVSDQSRALGQTIILTSHSMEECEILCDKLTIMVSGVMKCIGSVQHLKTRYAQGFMAIFKIIDSFQAHEKIPDLKNTITNVFGSSSVILKDEKMSSLDYQITDTSLSWSALFTMMEKIKSSHQDIVQDYVITDSSLEDVFISFAEQ